MTSSTYHVPSRYRGAHTVIHTRVDGYKYSVKSCAGGFYVARENRRVSRDLHLFTLARDEMKRIISDDARWRTPKNPAL